MNGGSLKFDWDPKKAASNIKKHGVSFEEAATAFGDPESLTIADPDHSDQEDRWILLGFSSSANLLVVVHTERGDIIRIISARRASKKEQRMYSQRDH
jgi:uncharacterized protein